MGEVWKRASGWATTVGEEPSAAVTSVVNAVTSGTLAPGSSASTSGSAPGFSRVARVPSWSARTTSEQSAPAGTGPCHSSAPEETTRTASRPTVIDRARSLPRVESGSAVARTTADAPSACRPARSRTVAQGAVAVMSIGRYGMNSAVVGCGSAGSSGHWTSGVSTETGASGSVRASTTVSAASTQAAGATAVVTGRGVARCVAVAPGRGAAGESPVTGEPGPAGAVVITAHPTFSTDGGAAGVENHYRSLGAVTPTCG